MRDELTLSTLGHTWILDLDGTLVKHNGYLTDGKDTWLPGALAFLRGIPEKDMVIFVTSRREEYRELTTNFLRSSGVRCEHMIFEAPYGERILINDRKPSGLTVGIAVNVERDSGELPQVAEDEKR